MADCIELVKPMATAVAKRNAAPKIQAPAPVAQDTPFQGVLTQLYSLLNEAWQTDDPDQITGDSDRLLSTGADLVMDLVRAETPESESTNLLYSVAAQIKAAMQVPGDTPSNERLVLVEQAGEILKSLLDDAKAIEPWRKSVDTSEVVPHARSLVTQVLDVIYCACEEIGADEAWGLYNLATWLDSRYECAESDSAPDFGTLGANTVATLAVLRLVNQAHDSSLIGAAEIILNSAREMLHNAEQASLMDKRAGGSHA